ncbi:MAG: efflux RND transporter periplasmic adaptor subunit [Planctomycetia bacterium]|nr:efflux RND transporter periplasmic adaptor subunit [Planctomycetia bacterium]
MLTFCALGAVAGAASLGYWYGTGVREAAVPTSALPPVPEGPPVVKVKTARVTRRQMEEMLTAYGSVVTALGETHVVSEPFESRVLKVLVRSGQTIASGDPLIEIAPSPDTLLQLDVARANRDTTQAELKLVEERLGLKLGTRADLIQARQKVQAAELQLANLEKRGVGGTQTIAAEGEGLVSRIDVQEGQIVAAGVPLLATIGEHQIHVRLGIEGEDLVNLQVGQAVRLLPVNAPESQAVEGRIHLITREVDPQTRLVNVFVSPPADARLLLHGYIEGRIVIRAGDVLAVPRSAVLPRKGEYLVYSVERGRAIEHVVEIGMESDQRAQVLGDNLQEGQEVVVEGNAELQDGMPVEVEPGP